MTIQALAWAIEQDVPGEAKLVLMALANHADHTTGECHFDAAIISRESTVGEPSLPRYLGALRRNGFLARVESKDGRRYWLQFDRDPARPWSWDAEVEDDAGGERRTVLVGGAAPSAFRPAEQAEQRDGALAPTVDRAAEGFPIIEGSRADVAWKQHYRKIGKPAPFSMSMIVDGRTVRGYRMPSLFPPGQQESAA